MKRDATENPWWEGPVFLLAAAGIVPALYVIVFWGMRFYTAAESVRQPVYFSLTAARCLFIYTWAGITILFPILGKGIDIFPGRRESLLFWGNIGLLVSAIAFWCPPAEIGSRINTYYAGAILTFYSAFFVVTLLGLAAWVLDRADTEKARIRIGLWLMTGLIGGALLSSRISPGVWTIFEPSEKGYRLTFSAEVEKKQIQAWTEEVFRGITPLHPDGAEKSVKTITLTGERYDRLMDTAREEAIAFSLPEALGGQYETVKEPHRVVLRFSEGILDKDTLEHIDKAMFSIVFPFLLEQEEVVCDAHGSWLVLPTPLAKGINPKELQTIWGDLSKSLPEKFFLENTEHLVRIYRPDAQSFEEPVRRALAEAIGRLSIRYHLQPLEGPGGYGLTLSEALTETLIGGFYSARLDALIPGDTFQFTARERCLPAAAYRYTAFALAIMVFFLFQWPIWLLGKRSLPDEAKAAIPMIGKPFFASEANQSFFLFCFAHLFLGMAVGVFLTALPDWGGAYPEENHYQTYGGILTAAITFLIAAPGVAWISRRIPPKWRFLMAFFWMSAFFVGICFLKPATEASADPAGRLFGLFACAGIGSAFHAASFVSLLGDIIDRNEQDSGKRSIGLYSGLHGAFSGFIIAMALWILPSLPRTAEMLGLPVNTPRSIGILAAGCCILGALTMLFYTPKPPPAETSACMGKE